MSDKICLTKASKEFKIGDNILKNAIKYGLINAVTKGKRCKILLSRKEIREKLPLLRTGTTFFRSFNHSKHSKQKKPTTPTYCMVVPKPVIPKLQRKIETSTEFEKPRPIVKVAGAPAWVSSPCINCRVDCKSETCQKLTDWVLRP